MRTARILPEASAIPRPAAAAAAALRALAAPTLTLALIVALALGVLAVGALDWPAMPWIAPPLAMLGLNLAAAIVALPAFRARPALLTFHLALLVIVALVALGRLTYFKGRIELSEGQTFDGAPAQFEAGPWHGGGIAALRFTNLGYRVHYAEGLKRGETLNAVRWIDERGDARAGVIGDNVPLAFGGYRIYTSFNKGFAPLLHWQPVGAAPAHSGTVHLPPYPANEHSQAADWLPPGAREPLWLMLDLPAAVLDPARASVLRVPSEHRLVVRAGSQRAELAPGESLTTPQGTLTYVGLRMWMGYNVTNDPTVPWLLAASAVAVVAMLWHYARRFARQPWWRAEATGSISEGGGHAG